MAKIGIKFKQRAVMEILIAEGERLICTVNIYLEYIVKLLLFIDSKMD
jgi:hypothetical protein